MAYAGAQPRRRRWRRIAGLTLAVLLVLVVARHIALGAGPNDPSAQVLSGGRVRTYRIHVPPSYRAGHPVALVLAFRR